MRLRIKLLIKREYLVFSPNLNQHRPTFITNVSVHIKNGPKNLNEKWPWEQSSPPSANENTAAMIWLSLWQVWRKTWRFRTVLTKDRPGRSNRQAQPLNDVYLNEAFLVNKTSFTRDMKISGKAAQDSFVLHWLVHPFLLDSFADLRHVKNKIRHANNK